MFDPHSCPLQIITNYLVITAIGVWHDEDWVVLMAFYGDNVDGFHEHLIEIECTFDQLNALLAEAAGGSAFFSDYAARAEEVSDLLVDALRHPTAEMELLNLLEKDPLYYFEHVFSLGLVKEGSGREADGQWDDPRYRLLGFTRRRTGWPVWEDGLSPFDDPAVRPAYFLRLLVLRYGLFEAYDGRVRRSEALAIAGLADGLLFALARVQYELLEAAVQARPEEFE